MSKIDFSKDIYRLLGCVDEGGELLEFPDWDVLKELDRREKRRKRASNNDRRVREWMREHPEEVERVRRERHADIPTYCSFCHRLNGQHDEGCPNS